MTGGSEIRDQSSCVEWACLQPGVLNQPSRTLTGALGFIYFSLQSKSKDLFFQVFHKIATTSVMAFPYKDDLLLHLSGTPGGVMLLNFDSSSEVLVLPPRAAETAGAGGASPATGRLPRQGSWSHITDMLKGSHTRRTKAHLVQNSCFCRGLK